MPAKAVLQTVKFLGKVIGSFLQLVAVSMNWCEMRSIDSLWLSLRMQWQGVLCAIPLRDGCDVLDVIH
ncbi:hypothetical protein ACFQD2_24380 [Pseudomonas lini]|nr:hypothetical protein TU81_13045 [Pseudomonas lini]